MTCDVMVENLFAWSQSITSPLSHADHATLVSYSCAPVPLAICSTVRRSRLYALVLYRLVSSRIVLYRLVSSCIVFYRLVSSCIVLYRLVSSSIVFYRLVSSCIVLYRLLSSCIVLYRLVSSFRLTYRYSWWSVKRRLFIKSILHSLHFLPTGQERCYKLLYRDDGTRNIHVSSTKMVHLNLYKKIYIHDDVIVACLVNFLIQNSLSVLFIHRYRCFWQLGLQKMINHQRE